MEWICNDEFPQPCDGQYLVFTTLRGPVIVERFYGNWMCDDASEDEEVKYYSLITKPY